MNTEEINVKGLYYTIDGVDSDFLNQKELRPLSGGYEYSASDSEFLRKVTTHPEREMMKFKHRNRGEYTFHT